MKTVRILAVLIVFLAVGCGDKVVEKSKLFKRGDLWYEVNSETPFTGKSVKYWSNGQKQSEGEYLNGKMHGKWTNWNENGQKKHEYEYRNGKQHGKSIDWYENEQKEIEVEYLNGKKHGKLSDWYENGQKKSEREFRNGEEHGKSVEWYWNGQKKFELNVDEGYTIKCWDYDGTPNDCTDVLMGLLQKPEQE